MDSFTAALGTPDRLLKLAPKAVGHPGNAAALSPAIVLTTISAFEGFAEDLMAVYLAREGFGLAHIAKEVGSWNNPTLADLSNRVGQRLDPPTKTRLEAGPTTKIKVFRENQNKNWTLGTIEWEKVLNDSKAWMEVRHLLTHGLVSGWRTEIWPPPTARDGRPGASSVLQPKGSGRSSLNRKGAKSCARIYSLGPKHVAEKVAGEFGETLDWSDLPIFT